jgi:hypothetical protein
LHKNGKGKMEISRYTNTENLNITYLFGAGASYNSVPIWNKQGETMRIVARHINSAISRNKTGKETLHNNPIIKELIAKLEFYSLKAVEFGTLDIYAKSLFLLDSKKELNDLKYHLSVYFDIWENFVGKLEVIDEVKSVKYTDIDKRYYSLLSVLLNKGNANPVLNSNVSFISWNYDLQLEMAYKSFIHDSSKQTLEYVNHFFKFFDREEKNDVVHLNGFRGYFNYENKLYPNVDNNSRASIEDYLLGVIENTEQFKIKRQIDYSNNIKYAWENNFETLKPAIDILEKTNVLIIIGYSFPSYNRKVDSKLITSLGKKAINQEVKQIIYQNPNRTNIDLIKNISGLEPSYIDDKSQFHIPHEFLFPQKAADMFFG